ncbi:MAG TPA: hypothetical protein VN369_07920 [Terriglobales bacterium]|nr:hypothetical protein [Terriglobales bacterium]
MNKTSKKTSIIIVFVMALGLLAFAYGGIILPNAAQAKTKKNLELLQKTLETDQSETLDSALAKSSDEVLLSTILEGAIYLEETENATAMALFVPSAMERIAPNVTPENLYDLYSEAQYPRIFKTFMLELTLVLHTTTDENGVKQLDEAYKDQLVKLLESDAVADDDELTNKVLRYLNGAGGMDILRGIVESDGILPTSKRLALEQMVRLEPKAMKPERYALARNFEQLDDQTLRGVLSSMLVMVGMEPELYSDAPQVAFEVLKAYMERDPRSIISTDAGSLYHAGHFSDSMLSFVGKIMGESHYPGFIQYIYSVPEKVPDMSFAIWVIKGYIYPEVDDLLLVSDGEFLDFLLDIVERSPYLYYKDTLQTLKGHDLEAYQAARVEELLDLIEKEHAYLPRPDLATKEGDWSED